MVNKLGLSRKDFPKGRDSATIFSSELPYPLNEFANMSMLRLAKTAATAHSLLELIMFSLANLPIWGLQGPFATRMAKVAWIECLTGANRSGREVRGRVRIQLGMLSGHKVSLT